MTPDLVILLWGGKREMTQFRMRYSLPFSLCPSSSNVSQSSFFFHTVIYIFVKRGRLLGWQIWWWVKLKERSHSRLLLLIMTEGNDFYVTFLIPETALAHLHITLVHMNMFVCVCTASVYMLRLPRHMKWYTLGLFICWITGYCNIIPGTNKFRPALLPG